MTAALFHVLNHSLFKSLLFFGAGAVLTATGARDLGRLGGLLNRMPATGLFVLIGCAAISALPPFNGFVSEWLVVPGDPAQPRAAVLDAETDHPRGRRHARAGGGAGGRLFRAVVRHRLSRPPAQPGGGKAPSMSIVSPSPPMGTLAALCLLAGIFPGVVIDALAPMVRGLVGVA